MKTEKFSDFNKEFKPLFEKFGGQPFKEDWFNRVQKAHSEIRDQIGGLKFEADVELNDGQGPASKVKASPLIDKIKVMFPSLERYLRQKYKGDETLESLLLWPNIQIDNHRQPKTSKQVLEWYDQWCKQNTRFGGKSQPKDRKELEKILSELGMLWARSKTKGASYRISLTTEASAFMMLGHYPIDLDSCFSQGGVRDHNKGYLGETDDTFVILIKENDEIVARFWGFASDEYEHYNVCNFYMAKGVLEGNVIAALHGFFAALKGVRQEEIFIHEDLVTDVAEGMDEEAEENEDLKNVNIYINEYGSFTFSVRKKLKEKQRLLVNTKIEIVNVCAKCRDELDDDEESDMREADGVTICPECLEDAHMCFKTKKYTLEPVLTIYNSDGDLYYAKAEFAKEFDKCKCGNYMFKGQLVNGKCYQCYDKEEYKKHVETFYINV